MIWPFEFAPRVTVNVIGAWPCSEPFAAVAATETAGAVSLSAIVPLAVAGLPTEYPVPLQSSR